MFATIKALSQVQLLGTPNLGLWPVGQEVKDVRHDTAVIWIVFNELFPAGFVFLYLGWSQPSTAL